MANQASQLQPVLSAVKKLLRVSLIGAPNAGKSTLMNRLIMGEVSCVSNKVHTTRRNILGVHTENDTQLEFLDSPGLVSRKQALRHHLDATLVLEPTVASGCCDLIGLVVDASNLRDCKRLNKTILSLLMEHIDKKSFLIINKVDLVKEKRILLDIADRLTEGHLEGRRTLDRTRLTELITRHSPRLFRSSSPHVIEMEDQGPKSEGRQEAIGFKNFSRVFSISALNDDGVDELREAMIQLALPVAHWPHGPEYMSDQTKKEVVHSIIRGLVMDNTDNQIPYVVRYNYLTYQYDELGALHINLELKVPNRYMVGKLLGQHGAIIFKITNESRERIQNCLTCDTKLNITVNSKEK